MAAADASAEDEARRDREELLEMKGSDANHASEKIEAIHLRLAKEREAR